MPSSFERPAVTVVRSLDPRRHAAVSSRGPREAAHTETDGAGPRALVQGGEQAPWQGGEGGREAPPRASGMFHSRKQGPVVAYVRQNQVAVREGAETRLGVGTGWRPAWQGRGWCSHWGNAGSAAAELEGGRGLARTPWAWSGRSAGCGCGMCARWGCRGLRGRRGAALHPGPLGKSPGELGAVVGAAARSSPRTCD